MMHKVGQPMTKPTKWHVRPTKTQINLGISPVWSVFAVRMKKAWVLSYPLSAQWRLRADWADAQSDLSLHWIYMPFCRFYHALAHIWTAKVQIGMWIHAVWSEFSVVFFFLTYTTVSIDSVFRQQRPWSTCMNMPFSCITHHVWKHWPISAFTCHIQSMNICSVRSG